MPPTPSNTPSTTLTADDRWNIQHTLAYYGHVADNAEWPALAEVFSADAHLDTPRGAVTGLAGVRSFEEAAFPGNPGSRHTLNTIIRPGRTPGTAVAWSRFLLVTAEGAAHGGDYLDTLELQDGAWLITTRRITERNRSRIDGGYSADGAETFGSWQARE